MQPPSLATLSPDPLPIGDRAWLELLHAECAWALSTAGVDTLVLKGPSLGEWLYPEGRDSADVDLLVRPRQWDRGIRDLGDSGLRAHVRRREPGRGRCPLRGFAARGPDAGAAQRRPAPLLPGHRPRPSGRLRPAVVSSGRRFASRRGRVAPGSILAGAHRRRCMRRVGPTPRRPRTWRAR